MSDENTTPAETPAPEPQAVAHAAGEPASAEPSSSLPETTEHVALPEHAADHAHTPVAEAVPAPATEPEPEQEQISEPEPHPELEPIAALTVSAPEPQAEAAPDHEVAPEAEPVAEVAESVAPVAEAEPEATEEVTPEPVAEAAPKKPKRAGKKKAEEPAEAEEVAAEPATEADAEAVPASEPAAAEPPPPDTGKKWYVVKVQSGREESIRRDIERKIKIQGIEESFGQIAIPTEDVVEKKKVKAKVKDKKTGEVETVYQEKNVTKKRKKFPGYLFAEVDFNDRILYVFRETSGVGDFVGATHHRAPNPMSDREVTAMLTGVVGPDPNKKKVKIKLDFEKGDKVRIREGAFSGMEGDVKAIPDVTDAASENTKVTVVVSIFGRPVDVELDYWQVDKA